MGHALVEQFCQAHTFQDQFLRRCQRVFRDEVMPQLDERDALIAENADLKAQLEQLQAKASRKKAEGVPV